IGGSLGTLFAWSGLAVLVRLAPPDFPRVWEGIHLDVWTLVFTALLTLAAGVIFGLAPAFQFASPALAQELNEGGRSGTAGRQRQRLRSALVVSEVAVSLMLLIGAGLMIRSFGRLLSQDLGYNPEHVITMGVGLPTKKYPGQREQEGFYERFLSAVQTLPGLESAALVLGLPLSGQNSNLAVQIHDAPPPAPGEPVAAGYAQVSPGYFRVMNIPILQGRDFTDHDRTNTAPVVVVDESFVKMFKLGTNVLGRRMGIGDGTESAEIIGVVKDTKRVGMAEAHRGEMYRSYKQNCWGYLTLVVRTQRDPAEVTRVVRAALDTLDKDLPLENVRTMTQLVGSSLAQRRLSVQLLGCFAGVALLLAALGLYGVLAYNVTQRTQEIGIRMALGAQVYDVLRLLLRQGMVLALAGIGLGLIGAFLLMRVLERLLFEIKPFDPPTFVLVTLLLSVVALLACWLPARRATKVDPMEALRYE
ncbi:MAG: ABC transporter permease, partial [Verrucomicrobiales bacterium]|nr:ABC transporter permease [Verrucomicrobiales bacterium]